MCVLVNVQCSAFFKITTGYAVAPEVFYIVIDFIMIKTTFRLSFALKLGDRIGADFVDDLAIMADSMWQLLNFQCTRLLCDVFHIFDVFCCHTFDVSALVTL